MDADLVATIVSDSAVIAFSVWRLTRADSVVDRVLDAALGGDDERQEETD